MTKPARKFGTTRGFKSASALLTRQVREAGESRGFAVSRVLTHWPEIAGPDIASHTRPVEIRYGRTGLGSVLTVLTTGAHAPMVEMQKERLRERVNACYGYNAVSAIRITQTASTGFAEGKAAFSHAAPTHAKEPKPEDMGRAREIAAPVTDERLRVALADLGANILSKRNHRKRS